MTATVMTATTASEATETPDPAQIFGDEAGPPEPASEPAPSLASAAEISVAPNVNYPEEEDDEPDPMFNMEKVREKVEASKLSSREQEEKLIASALAAKARKLLAERQDVAGGGAADGMNHLEFLDDLHDGKVRNFDDIFSRFPVGDGEFEVYVERKTPRRFRNTLIAGIQRPIHESMNHKEFAEIYGSGSYLLTVYGPTASGRLGDDGKIKLRPFTKPVRVDIPDPYNENPPNPEMAVVATPDLEDEEDMLSGGRRRIVGGSTDADAHIREVELRHQETTEERRIRELEAAREREDELRRESDTRQNDIMSRVLDQKESEMQMLRAELRDLRNKPSDEETKMSGVAAILQAVRPTGPSDSELTRLSQDLAEERRRNNEELRRLEDRHRQELERVTRDKDDRIREANEASRQREHDLRGGFEQRLSDERRQHDRDLAAAKENHMLMGETKGSAFSMQIEVKQAEITRLSAEVLRLQKELDDERKKSLADRVNEFSGAAEALGFEKIGEGESAVDWKNMVADAAVGFVKQAPALAAALRGATPPGGGGMQMLPPGSQQRALQAPMRAQMQMPAFATEDGAVDLSGMYNNPPVYPGQDPLSPVGAPPQARPPAPPAFQAPVEDEDVEDGEEDGGEEGGIELDDSQIQEFSGMFRDAFEKGAPPEEFADGIIEQLGPVMSGKIVRDLSLSRVTKALQAAPNGESDPLVRREGQQFLKKVWAVVEEKTS